MLELLVFPEMAQHPQIRRERGEVELQMEQGLNAALDGG